MTDYDPDTDFDYEPVPQPDPGSYHATLSDVERVVLDMKEGPTEFLRFTFTIPMEGEDPYITDAIAATMDSKGMRAFGNRRMKLTRWVEALLGKLPDRLNRDTLLGAQGLVVLDIDQAGYLKVVDVIAKPKGS